jgi:hypothetical protein
VAAKKCPRFLKIIAHFFVALQIPRAGLVMKELPSHYEDARIESFDGLDRSAEGTVVLNTRRMSRFYDSRRPDSWATKFRHRRAELLRSLMKSLDSPINVLDVGGTVGFWENERVIFRDMARIDITIIKKNLRTFQIE